MKVMGIHIQNYGPFANPVYFPVGDRGLTFVAGRNHDEPRMNANGVGKSSIFDALDWCLFGKVPREDHVDSVINDRAGKNCEVRVELDDQGTPIEVRRWRGAEGVAKHGVKLTVGGQDQTALDVAETQKRIELALGLDREIFHAAVLFAQNDLTQFADAGDAQRLEILTRILQLGHIDEYQERAKAKVKALNEQVVGLSTRKARLDGEITASNTKDFDALIAAFENERVKAVEQITQDLAGIATTQSQLPPLVDVTQLQAQVRALSPPPPPDQAELNTQIAQANNTIAEIKGKKMQITSEVGRLRGQIAQFQARGEGECPTCLQPVNIAHIQDHMAQWAKEADDLSQQIAEGDQAEQGWIQHVAQLEALRGRLTAAYNVQHAEYAQTKAQLEYQIAQALTITRQHSDLESRKTQYQATLQAKQQEPNPWLVARSEHFTKLARLRAELEQADKELEQMRNQIGVYEFWADAFGSRGLKNYILDHRLAEMTEAANHWIHLLTGGTFWVRFETQTMTRSKTLSNKFNIRVWKWEPDGRISERNYKSWSGGEKRRVSLGIDLGLNTLIARRSAKQWDLLILDEVFKHLDAKGREAVVDMLHQLRRTKASIFVIDHDAEFEGYFENRIIVEKRNGVSILTEAMGSQPAPVEQARNEKESESPETDGSVQASAPAKKRRASTKRKRGSSSALL